MKKSVVSILRYRQIFLGGSTDENDEVVREFFCAHSLWKFWKPLKKSKNREFLTPKIFSPAAGFFSKKVIGQRKVGGS